MFGSTTSTKTLLCHGNIYQLENLYAYGDKHVNLCAKKISPMVSLPDCQTSYMQEKVQKPNFFFKSVDLAMDGFKFTEFEEFKVNDRMPTTIRKLSHFDHEISMNDFFIVIMSITRRSATIIYKKNLKYVKTEDEIPNVHPPPYFLDVSCFNRSIEGKYYMYLKLLEAERVRLTFDSYIRKVVFNGDQIFFMFKTFIFIYTPLATCTLDIAAVDIAVNFYLYVLTADKILVYNEKLHKSIDIDKECKFIVPTPSHIFVIKDSFVYKVADNSAELYFDTLHHARDVVFDDRFMYVATKFSVMKIGLYEASSESIYIKVHTPRLKLCDKYIVLHNSNNGIGFIDKDNLQRFCFKMLNWDLTGMTTYKNEVAYLGNEELRIFTFVDVDGNLEPDGSERESFVNDPIKLRLPSEITQLINDKMGPYPYDYYGMTFNSIKFEAFEELKLFKSDQQKELDEDLKRLLRESERNPHAPGSVGVWGLPVSSNAAVPEGGNIRLDASIEKCINAQDCVFSQPEDDPISSAVPGQADAAKKRGTGGSSFESKAPEEVECLKNILNCDTFLHNKNIDPREDTASEESSSGLFFDDSEYLESKRLRKDPLLQHISRKRRFSSSPPPAQKTKQRIYSAFTRTQSHHAINNPYTHHSPLDAFDKGHMKLIRFSRRYETYQKTLFFCKNHFKFYKKMFRPRNEEEKFPKYHIYDLIDEEFKKAIGYKPDKGDSMKKQIDLSKRTKGGF